MWAVNWKRQKVLLTAALSPCLNSGVHIFIQCLRLNESDRSGLRFCLCRQSPVLCRIDWGHRDHKEQSSDEHGDNKSPPRTLIPSVAIQKEKKNKTMEDEPDRCVQQNHPEYSTPCHSISSVHIADETLSPSEPQRLSLSLPLVLSRRVSSNYRPRSPLSWGFFHLIKFYYKDWQWPSRGQRIQQEASSAYLKRHRLFMEPSEKI